MATTTHGNLTVSASGDAAERRLALAGRLDETVALVDHLGGWGAEVVVLETAGIQAINSLGIREWMHFVAGLNGGGARLVHEKCSEVLVEQMCFIPAVRAGGAVRSFHAPYYCQRCDLESSALIDVEIHGEGLRAMKAPGLPCPQCKGAMTLADVPERIFAFLVEH
ncbi:MAG: hypothetical protein F9K40_10760 [Kofleriaceae bacterium]|nr:MAG: hypothetical protein F9K40_10760 [Kofleriaceae bacterium]MBZ0231788.1 hypothetical protein [Kofleriaceae bacterium]